MFCCVHLSACSGLQTLMPCVFAGLPLPEVSWFRDGQVLSAAALPGAEISFSDGRAKLTISRVTPAHGGRFSIRATNGSGQATSTAELLVTGRWAVAAAAASATLRLEHSSCESREE